MQTTITFLLFLFCNLWSAHAQLNKGHIIYEIEISGDTDEMQAAADMMGDMEMELYFSPGKSKVFVKMGTLMNLTTTVDAEKEAVLILMSGMMGNKAIRGTLDQIEKAGKDGPRVADISLLDETKTIAGYDCIKAVVKTTDGNEIIYWYTEDIEVEKRGQENLNTDVPGFPMEFQTKQDGLNMTFTVSEVNETFDEDEEAIFNLEIPEGYDEMAFEELIEGKG